MAGAGTRPLVVVTGASGLLGSRIAADLARDHRVVGLDVQPPDGEAPSEHVECDLTDDESVERALARVADEHGPRVASVLHLAAYYDFSGEPSPLYEELTVRGTRRLLRGLHGLGVEQFVFSSSLLVMEPVEQGQVLTEDSPTEAEWAYPRSKLAAENVIRQERGSIPAVVLRIAGVYDEDGNSIPIAQQIARIREKRLESVFFPGDPDHGQAFVHVDDVVSCFRKVVEARRSLGGHELVLVAEPDLMSYGELQDELGELLHGREWPTLRIPAPLAKVGAWVKSKTDDEEFIQPWMIDLADAHLPVSIERARRLLGWDPRHRLRETLREIVRRLERDPRAWYERHGLPLPAALERHAARRGDER